MTDDIRDRTVHIINDQSERMAIIVDKLLDMSKIDRS